jgi:1-acyl-sn-glycerol-3-phosphate acyltransferase/acyl carrier protein
LNIDVASVAAELRRQPGVKDAMVLENPEGPAGTICAVLIMQPGARARDAIQATNAHLPDAARLRRWLIWPGADLPRTPTGKARRTPIIEWLHDQRSPSATSPPIEEDGASTASIIRDWVSRVGGFEDRAVELDTPLMDLLDSLQRVELAAFLEESFGLTPGHDLFVGQQTISQLVEMLEETSVEPDVRASGPEAERDPGLGDARISGDLPIMVAGDRPQLSTSRAASLSSIREGPSAAAWRYWPSTRAIRWLLREALVRPSLAAVLRVRSSGLEHLDSLDPPFLLSCNHVSILDPLVLLQVLPRSLRYRIAPAAMSQHFTDHPNGRRHYRWGVLGLNLFPLVQVGDWRPTLRIAGGLADRGYCPLIYPEGQRSDNGRPQQFHLGVTVLSQEVHLPIVPCASAGLFAAMPVGSKWPRRDGLRRPTVAVCFGEPIPALRRDTDRQSALRHLEDSASGLFQQALAIAGRE